MGFSWVLHHAYLLPCLENIKPKLATVFETNILTEKLLNVDVKPTPPGTAGIAYYEAGTPDGRRDGVFYVNRY